MDLIQSTDFWLNFFKIIWINIILSGDNAVVIALAARGLPAEQQKKAILFGSGAAVILRIALTVVAAGGAQCLHEVPFEPLVATG